MASMYISVAELFSWVTAVLLLAVTLYLFFTFLREGSIRAANIGGSLFVLAAALWTTLIVVFPEQQILFLTVFYSFAAILLAVFFFPTGKNKIESAKPTERIDERLIMFARGRYKAGDGKYEAFYAEYPELQNGDDFTRTLPNIGEPGGETYDPLNASISNAFFGWIDRVRETVNGEVSTNRHELTPEDASRRLKGLARWLGAVEAGTTAVHPGHVYSRIGRGTGEWGAELQPDQYPYALVFAVEMKSEMMASAPNQPVLADSSRQYLTAAMIALAAAEYLRTLGYQARAHIDGNYRLVMPPLAADAGLGEIGRHSLLITPKFGARVRLGAVTTDLPLAQDAPVNFGVEDFCNVCLKCADNCLTSAIPAGDKAIERGTRYWKINSVKCYRYWRGVGTDCGICVSVCPYSRPRGPIHSFVRAACARSALSRRIFARMDDLFYGKKPRSDKYPEWMKAGMKEKNKQRISNR